MEAVQPLCCLVRTRDSACAKVNPVAIAVSLAVLLRRTRELCGLVAAGLGAVVLISWFSHSAPLATRGAQPIPVAPTSRAQFCFARGGIGLDVARASAALGAAHSASHHLPGGGLDRGSGVWGNERGRCGRRHRTLAVHAAGHVVAARSERANGGADRLRVLDGGDSFFVAYPSLQEYVRCQHRRLSGGRRCDFGSGVHVELRLRRLLLHGRTDHPHGAAQLARVCGHRRRLDRDGRAGCRSAPLVGRPLGAGSAAAALLCLSPYW